MIAAGGGRQCRRSTRLDPKLYRHPKPLTQTYDYISDLIKHVSLKDKPFYILGDFNDNILCDSSKMRQIISNAKLTQVISKPTRITPTSATLIDLIITNKSQSILHSVADHELITVTVNLKKPKRPPTIKTFRDLTTYSPDLLSCLLKQQSYNLNKIFTTDNVDTQVNIFTNIFNNCLDDCAPLTTKEVKRPFAPWIDENLRALMHERDTTQKHLKNDRFNVYLQLKFKKT